MLLVLGKTYPGYISHSSTLIGLSIIQLSTYSRTWGLCQASCLDQRATDLGPCIVHLYRLKPYYGLSMMASKGISAKESIDHKSLSMTSRMIEQPLNSNRILTIAIESSIINQSYFYPRRPCSARIVMRTDRPCVSRHFSTGMLRSMAKVC